MEIQTRKPAACASASFSGLEAHLGYWLRLVSNHVSNRFKRALLAQQVSVAEWVLLRQLHARPEMIPGELAEALALTRGAVSKVLDKVEAKSWIKRTTQPQDNRVQLLSITDQGRRVLPTLAAIADHNDRHFFDCLDPAEQESLRCLLQKVADFHQIRNVPVD
ncbi:MAG TPA: MarR family transcriptional regulator [Chthoniobacterales bacterium]